MRLADESRFDGYRARLTVPLTKEDEHAGIR
jgi:hypothetical protein